MMVYNPDITIDEDVALIGGDFNNPANWTTTASIVVGGGVAAYNQVFLDIPICQQVNNDFISGNLYEITYTVTNSFFDAVSTGCQWQMGGGPKSTGRKTDGTFTDIILASNIDNLVLFTFGNTDIIDSCDISAASLVPLTNITEKISEIKAQYPQAAVDYEDNGNGKRHIILSYRDKTNCIVKYAP